MQTKTYTIGDVDYEVRVEAMVCGYVAMAGTSYTSTSRGVFVSEVSN